LVLCRWRKPSAANEIAEVLVMLSWVVTFLVVALIGSILGFGGSSTEITKIIFSIVVVLFLVSALIGVARGRTRV